MDVVFSVKIKHKQKNRIYIFKLVVLSVKELFKCIVVSNKIM